MSLEQNKRALQALVNLRGSPDFQQLREALSGELEAYKSKLVKSSLETVPQLQGRAQELVELLDTFENAPALLDQFNRRKP